MRLVEYFLVLCYLFGMGRRLLYKDLILKLNDGEFHSPGTIANLHGGPKGEKDRIRKALHWLKENRDFPPEGDSLTRLRQKGIVPVWKSERWKQAVE